MIFSTLYESSQRGELLLDAGGFCHWHLRRDGQLTIREIISQRPGAGQEMLAQLCGVPGATSLFAKCPAELSANAWYARRGFVCEGQEVTRGGAALNLWRLALPAAVTFRQPHCLWQLADEYDEPWQGSCGILWVFTDAGTPQEHGVNFCPRCGRTVVVGELSLGAGDVE